MQKEIIFTNDAPKAIGVPPTITEELARLLLAIDEPVVKTSPVLFGNVIVLSLVGSTAVIVVSFESAVGPSNTIPELLIAIELDDSAVLV